MVTDKRIKILTGAEIDNLYAAPVFSENVQRFVFTLNDVVNAVCRRVHLQAIHHRGRQSMP